MECEQSICNDLIPVITIQCDYEDFIDVPHKQVWVSCKFRGQPSVNGFIRGASLICNTEDFSATLGRNSLCVKYNPTNHFCRFIPAFKVFQNIHSKAVVSLDAADGGLGVSTCGAGKLVIWDNNTGECDKFVQHGAIAVQTPLDVIEACDITFSCVADPKACKEVVFGNCGVMAAMGRGKGYVEMTSIDPATSMQMADSITTAGGRYLEAQIQGSRCEAEEGSLVIVAAGDRNLFDNCQTCFEAMSKNSFFLGDVGNASKMNLILNMMSGIAMAGMAEGLALADRSGVQQNDVLEVFQLTQMASPLLVEKAKGKPTAVIEGGFPTNQALSLMQKDLRLTLALGDEHEIPLPLCAASNEIFKHAKRLGYGDHDVSAVYIRARF